MNKNTLIPQVIGLSGNISLNSADKSIMVAITLFVQNHLQLPSICIGHDLKIITVILFNPQKIGGNFTTKFPETKIIYPFLLTSLQTWFPL
ncbi:MAG: hypothetical protein IIA61_06350 [Candidatus Marinimicrobia bacterium]|nr:hypothetical protein [Candidatus Neomarinimicrobiota bacterium]